MVVKKLQLLKKPGTSSQFPQMRMAAKDIFWSYDEAFCDKLFIVAVLLDQYVNLWGTYKCDTTNLYTSVFLYMTQFPAYHQRVADIIYCLVYMVKRFALLSGWYMV